MLDKKFISKLKQEGRDVEGKLLQAETEIICNPRAPAEFMEDSPGNRELFAKNGFAWSDPIREEVYFPSHSGWDAGFKKEIEDAQVRCREFQSAIDQNVCATRGTSLPDANLPSWLFLLPYMPKIKKVKQIANLGRDLIEKVCRQGHVPSGISPPAQWTETLETLQNFQIYELTGQFGRFHVVSVFATLIRFSPEGQPMVTQSDPGLLNTIQSIYDGWSQNKRSVNFTFFTLGSPFAWPKEMTGTNSAKSWTALSAPSTGKRWDTSAPPQFTSKLYLRDFLEALRPETAQERVVRIKKTVDDIIENGFDGNITLEKIAKETPYRRTLVRYAFQEMQESGHYECYRVKKDIAIRDREVQGGIIIHPQEHPIVKYRLGILIPAALGVLAQQCLNYISSGNFQVLSFLIIPPFVYAGKCLEIIIKRNQADL